MKKLIIILLLLPLFTKAQNHFKPLEQKESINSIIVDAKMLEIMANIEVNANNAESNEYQKLIKSISNLKMFIDESGKHKAEMLKLFKAYISTHSLKEQKVNNNKVICYIKKRGSTTKLSELLLFTENINNQNETIVILVKGDFELKQAETLIKNLKITGAKLFNNTQ